MNYGDLESDNGVDRLEGICLQSLVERLSNQQLVNLTSNIYQTFTNRQKKFQRKANLEMKRIFSKYSDKISIPNINVGIGRSSGNIGMRFSANGHSYAFESHIKSDCILIRRNTVNEAVNDNIWQQDIATYFSSSLGQEISNEIQDAFNSIRVGYFDSFGSCRIVIY